MFWHPSDIHSDLINVTYHYYCFKLVSISLVFSKLGYDCDISDNSKSKLKR